MGIWWKQLQAHWAEVICAGVLLCVSGVSVAAINRTAVTGDEIMHIPAGYYNWTDDEYNVNPEHPPLVKMWSAIPLLWLLPKETGPAEAPGDFSERGQRYTTHFWSVNRTHFLSVSFWTRLFMVGVTIALGTLLFVFTKRLFGKAAAVFSILLFSVEPTILGHGKLVHTDVAGAFVYLLFFFALYRYTRRPTWSSASILGLVTAVALLTKFSMLILLPILGAALLVQLIRIKDARIAVHALLVGAIVLLAVNVVYRFGHETMSAANLRWMESTGGDRSLRLFSGIVPSNFIFGAHIVAGHNKSGHGSSLLGKYDYRGWWYYFPVTFALKVPLPFLILAIAGIAWSTWQLAGRREYLFLIPLVPLGIYAALAMSSRINIGVRHFLPAYPFLLMMAGAFLAWVCHRAPRLGMTIALCAIAIMGIEAIRTFPYYLSYANVLGGRAPAWSYLSDSNVEWGDAVPELAHFLNERGITRVRAALLGGGATLSFYGIEYVDIFSATPAWTDYTVLGASFLNGSTVAYGDATNGRGTEEERVNFFDAYRRQDPVAVFGNSLYVFRSER